MQEKTGKTMSLARRELASLLLLSTPLVQTYNTIDYKIPK